MKGPTETLKISVICEGIEMQDHLREHRVPWVASDTSWNESH